MMKDNLFYYCFAIASLVIFLHGFFPVQQNHILDPVPLPSSLNDVQFNKSNLYKPEISRIILIIIDALRLDFISEANVPFIISSYRNMGCILTVNVQSPTVTLPRIKALTTGDIPQFVDVIFNLASTEALRDSFLHKAREAGKKIVFYGDDTWIKLYPDIFSRYEGVSSFYVNDYTEVDHNVTRNLIKELNDKDWDVMLLHYLGLDHIGHVYGPYSNLIQPKLKEMDDIVKKISYSLNTEDGKTLIIITGDHGMKDSGGHGGSTFSETHVPFISIGIPCIDDTVAQTDIPSTLSSLFGIPHPADNIGCVISNMLIDFSYERLLYILRYNVMFLKAKLNECEDLFEKASVLHYEFLKTANESDAIATKQLYESCSKQISDKLVHSSTEQDIHSLLIGNGILMIALCAIFYNFISSTNVNSYTTKMLIIIVLILEITIPKVSLLRTLLLAVISAFEFYYVVQILRTIRWKPTWDINSCIIVGSAIYSFSLASSSFIEEEHQIWYFFFSTFLMMNCRYIALDTTKGLQWLLLFLALRIIRTVNQTGDKWAHLPDLSQWLLLEENYFYLEVLYCTSLILVLLCCILLLGKQKITIILNSIILLLIYTLHTYSTVQNIFLVRIIWSFIVLNLLFAFLQRHRYLEHIIIMWTLFSILLMRPYNVILIPVCIFMSNIISNQVKDVRILTVIHIWLGRTLFFCQGHSNSLASIDVASGYIGIQEYVPVLVIMQVLCHTYVFPVLTSLLVLKNNSHQETIWTISILCRLLVLTTTCIITLIHQHHLFIWTVFAPKLLIESCHTAVLFVEIVMYYCIMTVQRIFVNFSNKEM